MIIQEVLKLVSIKIYDESEIDITSDLIRQKISNSIKQYIIDNWDKCVQTKSYKTENDYRVEFNIEL